MDEYEQILLEKVEFLKAEGYSQCAFGDIFLEDLREYREQQLEPFGIKALFPLWQRPTRDLISEFLDHRVATNATTDQRNNQLLSNRAEK